MIQAISLDIKGKKVYGGRGRMNDVVVGDGLDVSPMIEVLERSPRDCVTCSSDQRGFSVVNSGTEGQYLPCSF